MPRVTITIPEKTAQPYRFKLDREVVTLGRNDENDIVIESGSVSGKHAEMRRVPGGYELIDLGSTNGTKLNDERQQKIVLSNDISVSLGDVDFGFMLNEEELQVLAEEQAPVQAETAPTKPQLPAAPLEEPATPEAQEVESATPPAQEEESEQSESKPLTGMVLMGILLVLLAIGAFFIGASVRHQKETGEPLFKAITNKTEQLERAAAKEKAAATQELADEGSAED
jgi:pSer/pThr/pTyr-binding forkhead associated (FHA) protein